MTPPSSDQPPARPRPKLPAKRYEEELLRLQVELVKLQEWVRATNRRVAVLFEGRDAAGKGGTISRITQYLNPRVVRVAALPAPTERERSQWYFQRYVEHLPRGGEVVLFDRSWYNRAGVEYVMGFCTPEEHELFLAECPTFERLLIDSGLLLIKYWFSVSDDEQERRFETRITDPLKHWKLSPVDLESRRRWVDYSKAKDIMFERTDIPESPWYVVEADDKRRARINCISHLLSHVPYEDVIEPPVKLPPRQKEGGYVRPPLDTYTYVPDVAARLLGS
jgi:polyphosphate kinase